MYFPIFRDFAVRVMMGTRVSLSVGLLASVLVLLIGATYGAISAFAGGWIDNIMMRITDILYTIPDILLIILLAMAIKEPLEGLATKPGFPCKVPSAHEPVLLPESDIVLAVAGLSALGRPLLEVCFRLEQACALLGAAPETLLTPELLARLLASEQGGRKLVGNRRFSVVLNQADAPARIAAGEQTLALLRKKYEVQGVLTYFDERERA